MSFVTDSEIKRKVNRIHVHPQFYGVYVLQSIPKPRSFYIGSTPDPKRRIRQHNGELKAGGAYRTRKDGFRPWSMIVIMHNFPSKIAALQFEHALQHPYQTRHIEHERRITQKRNTGNTLHHKLGNIRLLLQSLFFGRMGLEVLIFDEEIYSAWCENKYGIDIPDSILVNTVQFQEFFSSKDEDSSHLSMHSLNTNENDYFEACKKTLLFDDQRCNICFKTIEYVPDDQLSLIKENSLDRYLQMGNMPLVAICYHEDCNRLYHLSCLSLKFLSDDSNNADDDIKSLTPLQGKCLSCNRVLNWSKLSKMATKLRLYFIKDSYDLGSASQFHENDKDD